MEENMPFGISKEKGIFEEYIGKYVIIYPHSGNFFAGKITKIHEGFAKLNPHQAGIQTDKGLIRKMINEDSIVNLSNINGIEPTTKENLENFCNSLNSQNNI